MTNFMPLFRDLLNYSSISATSDLKLLTLKEYDEFSPIFDISMDLMGGLQIKDILLNELDLKTTDENLDYLEGYYKTLSDKQLKLKSVQNSIFAYKVINSCIKLNKLIKKLKFMTLVHTDFEVKLDQKEIQLLEGEVTIKFEKDSYFINNSFVIEEDILNHLISKYIVANDCVGLLMNFIDKVTGIKQVSKSKFTDLLADIENITLLTKSTDE